MDNKCNHPPCSCTVETGKQFCSDACRDLASVESQAHGRCGCDHVGCAGRSAPK